MEDDELRKFLLRQEKKKRKKRAPLIRTTGPRLSFAIPAADRNKEKLDGIERQSRAHNRGRHRSRTRGRPQAAREGMNVAVNYSKSKAEDDETVEAAKPSE
jgi:hypothetical protein